MGDSATGFLFLPGMFLCVLLFVEIGRRIGVRRIAGSAERERAVESTIETAIYALLGLILAFTFAGSASRFDARRTLTVLEANAIGTAYLRLDLLPAAAQPPLRGKFRRYTEARIAVFQVLPDIGASNEATARAAGLQDEIWTGAVAALKDAPPHASLLLLPALNDMFDIAATRGVTLKSHTPTVILATLGMLSLVCSLLIGYGLAGGKRFSMLLHTIGFALVLTVTVYVIIDLDHPRVGLIRLDYTDEALMDVLAGMK
jgi:hypothetical protein